VFLLQSAIGNSKSEMPQHRLKTGYFVLEGLNSFVTTFYLYYLYFFMHTQFGFGNKANLTLAALNGLVYMLASWFGGRFAQRAGYFTALKLGFAVMLVALAAGTRLDSATGHVLVMVVTVAGVCFTWPALEALISEGESLPGLQHNVGIYNVVWAATGAVAYFTGGAMLEKLGMTSLYFVPIVALCIQLAMTLWLERLAKSAPHGVATGALEEQGGQNKPRSLTRARAFLRMAWLANPFAYIAINTLVAVIPGLAQRLDLSPMMAGFCCSAWCFARLGAFVGLWCWPGWHYRFRWLLAAFLTLIGAFVVILSVPILAVLVTAQLLFGSALGLIYYSSLFYSMDVGETKGEHGGIHEAVIGLGNFTGPAVGAMSLQFFPQYTSNGVVAVAALLVCGLAALLAIWRMTKT